MEISKVQFITHRKEIPVSANNRQYQTLTVPVLNQTTADCFVKNSAADRNSIGILSYKPSFVGKVPFLQYDFEKKFTRSFFVKLLREGVPDAYSDIERLIPREEYDKHRQMQTFGKKSSIAVKYLKKYKNSMFPVEKEIFTILENLSKKHPDLTLQELLRLRYPQAEQVLINQQGEVLNKINMMIRSLPKQDFIKSRKLIQGAFDRIFAQEQLPEERFGRKIFLAWVRELDIADKKIKSKVYKMAEKLPQSSDSVNAFIVKYSHPYKLRYDFKKQEMARLPRDSQEIGERLLEPSIGTDDHIHAQRKFKEEQAARLHGDEEAKNKSALRVTTLTSAKANFEKSDLPLDKYIELSPYDIPKRIQHQIDRYISIGEKWLKQGRIADADLLSEYIIVLRDEYARRSNIVKVDISELERKLPQIKAAVQKQNEKAARKSGGRHKPQPNPDNASNSHSEHYIDASGRVVENRKVQKHTSRYRG